MYTYEVHKQKCVHSYGPFEVHLIVWFIALEMPISAIYRENKLSGTKKLTKKRYSWNICPTRNMLFEMFFEILQFATVGIYIDLIKCFWFICFWFKCSNLILLLFSYHFDLKPYSWRRIVLYMFYSYQLMDGSCFIVEEGLWSTNLLVYGLCFPGLVYDLCFIAEEGLLVVYACSYMNQ